MQKRKAFVPCLAFAWIEFPGVENNSIVGFLEMLVLLILEIYCIPPFCDPSARMLFKSFNFVVVKADDALKRVYEASVLSFEKRASITHDYRDDRWGEE